MSTLGKEDTALEVLEMAQPQVIVEKGHVADPSPLGLAAFALTTFLLSANNAGWAQDYSWVGLALFYGGLVQLLAGMWEFKKNNTFGATVFSTYGGFWMSLGMFELLVLLNVFPRTFNANEALGWFTCGFFLFNTYMMACALLTNYAILTVLATLEVTLFCTFIGNFSQSAGWIQAGGYFGVVTAVSAFYASFANCFNSMVGREIVPVGVPVLTFTKQYTARDFKR